MQNRRLAPRRKTLLGARILADDRAGGMECVLRDLSKSGAKIVLGEEACLPPRFELHVPHLKRRYEARTAWHRPGEIGVRLVPTQAEPSAGPADLLDRVRRLEAEKRALQQRVLELTGG